MFLSTKRHIKELHLKWRLQNADHPFFKLKNHRCFHIRKKFYGMKRISSGSSSLLSNACTMQFQDCDLSKLRMTLINAQKFFQAKASKKSAELILHT
jgi:hypothetical protein